MTEFTYHQLDAFHGAMCLAWSMSPRICEDPSWPLVWDGEIPPPWKPLWRDFIQTLDIGSLGTLHGLDVTIHDMIYHLNSSLRLGSSTLINILNRPLLWEHIWVVKQYLNEIPDDPDYTFTPPDGGMIHVDIMDDTLGECPQTIGSRALQLLKDVMRSDDGVLSHQSYVEICNVIKELDEAVP